MANYYDVPAPEAGKIFAYKAGTTHETFAVPSAWLGRKVDVTARAPGLNSAGQAAAVWLVFGTAVSVAADRTAFVTGTPPAWTAAAGSGRPIRDGETRDYFVKSTMTHFSVESDLADVEVYITPSDFPDIEG